MRTPDDADAVRNVPAQQALAAFAAHRDRQHWVLAVRTLLQGRLLTDVTQAVRDPEDGTPASVSGGRTTGGVPVVFAYTDLSAVVAHTGVARPDVAPVTAVGALQLAAAAGPGTGLAVDPAGAGLVVDPAELAAVLRSHRNGPVKEALVLGDRDLLLRVLAAQLAGDAVLLEAVTAPTPSAPVVTTHLPDGRAAALAFSSALEVEAVLPGSASAVRPLRAYLEHLLAVGRPGLVLDPAGPSVTVTPDELRRVLGA
ncbi:SseB family protein [Modestobacter sp. Leaf380]|uniref:SseB family protein n=1 Tax=Modestobacter sp. Leaf380 TaxID=1736356 RepID=UPI0012FBFB02|nr:SseB family protein [Modestobacter sp. Leaf380]